MAAQSPFSKPGPRIAVVGVTGSGKTTTAQHLSRILSIPHIELDSFHWQPNWVPMETEPFRQEVAARLTGPAWVIDGNYGKARDIIWSRATSLVWLDYPLPLVLWQLTHRTLGRIARQEVLWNTNRETWRDAFLSKESLFLWALQTHPIHRREYPQLLRQPEYAHLQLIHLRSRGQTNRWLSSLEKK